MTLRMWSKGKQRRKLMRFEEEEGMKGGEVKAPKKRGRGRPELEAVAPAVITSWTL